MKELNFIRYSQLVDDVVRWCKGIPNDFDFIIGIPRTGLIVATIVSQSLNIPLSTKETSKEGKRVLIVDDSISSGKTMNTFKKQVKGDIKCGAVYFADNDKHNFLDFKFKKVSHHRFFEWNLNRNSILSQSCVDIDGVLCEDPTPEQNDDGLRYIDFIKNSKQIFYPTRKILTLVTCRLEKYRGVTEEWLKGHEITYDNLIMMNYPTKEARLAAGNHAPFKGKVYKNSPTVLFIESSLNQAIIISMISNKPVLCTENMRLF